MTGCCTGNQIEHPIRTSFCEVSSARGSPVLANLAGSFLPGGLTRLLLQEGNRS
jgi:hypothetical protein